MSQMNSKQKRMDKFSDSTGPKALYGGELCKRIGFMYTK